MSEFSRGRVWTTIGARTVYARVFKTIIDGYKPHFSEFEGAYEKVEGGYLPQHRRKKIWKTEKEAKKDVLEYAINGHQKEIQIFLDEINSL